MIHQAVNQLTGLDFGPRSFIVSRVKAGSHYLTSLCSRRLARVFINTSRRSKCKCPVSARSRRIAPFLGRGRGPFRHVERLSKSDATRGQSLLLPARHGSSTLRIARAVDARLQATSAVELDAVGRAALACVVVGVCGSGAVTGVFAMLEHCVPFSVT